MLKSALNRVLTLTDYRYRRELSIDVLYVTRASICVELWPFYCSKRILVPMSDISFFMTGWDETSILINLKNDLSGRLVGISALR